MDSPFKKIKQIIGKFEGDQKELERGHILVWFKGRVKCFSMQDVINKRFLLNPEKSCRFQEKRKFNSEK